MRYAGAPSAAACNGSIVDNEDDELAKAIAASLEGTSQAPEPVQRTYADPGPEPAAGPGQRALSCAVAFKGYLASYRTIALCALLYALLNRLVTSWCWSVAIGTLWSSPPCCSTVENDVFAIHGLICISSIQVFHGNGKRYLVLHVAVYTMRWGIRSVRHRLSVP